MYRISIVSNEKTGGRRVFPQVFQVLPDFHECFYNSIETRKTCSFCFRKHRDAKKKIKLFTLTIKM